MQVVEHEADVAVDIPVEREGVDGLAPPGDAIGSRELIVEVNLAHASGDFPGTPAAAVQRERMRRLHAVISGIGRVITSTFACRNVAGLSVTALELQARRTDQRHAGVGGAIDIVPEILALEDHWSIGGGR